MMILEMIVDSLGGKRYGQSLDGLTGRVGYVYPDNEESYYVHSDISEWRDIECVNGHFYAELQS